MPPTETPYEGPTIDDVKSGPRHATRWSWKFALAGWAAVYAIAMLMLAGVSVYQMYAPNPIHRLQAAALLDGHLYIGDSLYQVEFDNVFHDGKVQQVWGLGVGMWLVPFELVARIFGLAPMPERVSLGVALFLLALYAGGTAIRMIRAGNSVVAAVGFPHLVLLSPPLWALMVLGPQNVYEDSSIYALILSLALLVAVVRYCLFASQADLWICAGLAAFTGFVRPTHLVYGLLGVGICCAVGWLRKQSRIALVASATLFGVGVALLLFTNQIRFGSPTEFGHRVTLSGREGLMASRFVNPIKNASVWAASNELLGGLFFVRRDLRTMGDMDFDLFPGQTRLIRWRSWYINTYEPSMLICLLSGLVIATISVRAMWRSRRARNASISMENRLVLVIAFWAVPAVMAIHAFLLYYHGISSRYLYDYWPGFLGLVLIVWLRSSMRFPRSSSVIFAIWMGFLLWRADCRELPKSHLMHDEIVYRIEANQGKRVEEFHGLYDTNQHPSQLPLKFPEFFWDQKTGLASYVAQVPVDRPEFIELVVGPRIPMPNTPTREDVYRARIDNSELRLRRREVVEQGRTRLVFEVPESIRRKKNIEYLFLCFVSIGDWTDCTSDRPLYSINWR